MEFIRSVIVQDETPAADGTVSYDLPTNPLSFISFVIKALNATDEASLANILALVTKIEVLFQGAAVFSLSAADLFALNCIMFGRAPILTNQVATDNATRSVGLTIPMGRKLFDPTEAFREVKKGELQLQATVDIATSEADGLILQVETTELLGASPTRHLKVTTLSKTPSATGDMDVDLPIGNKLAGIMLWGTTIPTTTAWTTTIDQVRLMIDNVETNYAKANWEALHADLLHRTGQLQAYDGSANDDDIANYALMDFDPVGNDEFLVNTSGKSSVKVRINAGDTNALRVLPIEIVEGGGA